MPSSDRRGLWNRIQRTGSSDSWAGERGGGLQAYCSHYPKLLLIATSLSFLLTPPPPCQIDLLKGELAAFFHEAIRPPSPSLALPLSLNPLPYVFLSSNSVIPLSSLTLSFFIPLSVRGSHPSPSLTEANTQPLSVLSWMHLFCIKSRLSLPMGKSSSFSYCMCSK